MKNIITEKLKKKFRAIAACKVLNSRASRVTVTFIYLLSIVSASMLFPQKAHAAIAERGTQQTATGNAVTSLTINKPTGVVSGDVMIASIATTGTPTITATGWTAIDATNNSGRLSTFYKVAGGSEPTNYSFSWTGAQSATGGVIAFSGVDNNQVIDNAGAAHSTNTGSASPATANAVTTATANAMLVATYTIQNSSGFGTYTAGMTEEYDIADSGGDTSHSMATGTQASAGSTGTKTATVSADAWVAHMVALKPSPPTFDQSAYRFSINADSSIPNFITDNLTAGDDTVRGTALDSANGYFLTVGDNGTNWAIQKRRVADGSLCTSANCNGTTFGTAGRITEDVASSTNEKANAIAIDVGAGVIYVGGYDRVTTNSQWRLEKRDMYTGALITSFGSSGIVSSNPTASDDEITAIVLDKVNGYVYAGGYDGTGNNQWRMEKYRYSDGAICTAANCGTAFGTNGVYTNNQSNGNDRIVALEIDPTNTFLYVAGFDTKTARTQWTLWKLRADNAAGCSAANCGTQFGVNGLYESNPTSRDDQIQSLQVDSAANAIYLGGFEEPANGNYDWRLEKIDLNTAAFITSFGGSGCNANQNGALCTGFSAGLDKVTDMDLDGAGGFIYVMGVMDEAGLNSEWRIQKRNRSDGSLVSGWATSGTISINPSGNADPSNSMVVDTEHGNMWAMGGDRTLGTTNMQWYFVPFNLDTGTIWLAAQDTVAVSSPGVSFRLRLDLHVNNETMSTTDGIQLKLQSAFKNGTCDTAFVGETYADVPTSGNNEILYHDNPSNADAISTANVSGDPVHSGHTNIYQTLEEANNLTNTSNVSVGQDGLWGFVLRDNNAFGAYCFRVVYSDGSPLTTYSVVPEITFCRNDPRTDNLLRHGTFFCEGTKKPFFWVQ